MPTLDSQDRVVGPVLRELKSGNYVRTYLVLSFESHRLLCYPEEAENAKNLSHFDPVVDINCQWITKVDIASSRPRVLHCFIIKLPTGSHIFSVDSDEERHEWVESITKSSMRQGTGKEVVASMQKKKDVSYRTKVVGGVVQRIPLQSNQHNGSGGEGGKSAEGSSVPLDKGVGRKTRGFPRVISAGHGIKLGAVMKNWKRRFFVLTEVSLGYYKSIEEEEPIRSVSVGDMVRALPSKELPGKEHMFEVVTPSRTYFIQVESEEEVEEWVRAITELLRTVRSSRQPLPPSTNSGSPLEDSEDETPSTLV